MMNSPQKLPPDHSKAKDQNRDQEQRVSTPPLKGPIMPLDALSIQLTGIWQNLLDRESVGVTDPFFEVGGTSASAIQLAKTIQNIFGVVMDQETITENPTIAQLAVLIGKDTNRALYPPLIPMQQVQGSIPFFCVHPLGGTVFPYLPLAWSLAKTHSFYGLQSPGLIGQPTVSKFSKMATLYVQEMLAVTPEGPYCLGGWSMGGFVALEMAHQLKKLGKQVSLLAILDTYPLPRSPEVGSPLSASHNLLNMFLFGELDAFFGGLPQIPPQAKQRLLEGFAGRSQDQCFDLVIDEFAGSFPRGVHVEEVRDLWRISRANYQAIYDYQTEPFEGDITLFSCNWPSPHELANLNDKDHWARIKTRQENYWRELTRGSFKTCKVPGSHHSSMQMPAAEKLADLLRQNIVEST